MWKGYRQTGRQTNGRLTIGDQFNLFVTFKSNFGIKHHLIKSIWHKINKYAAKTWTIKSQFLSIFYNYIKKNPLHFQQFPKKVMITYKLKFWKCSILKLYLFNNQYHNFLYMACAQIINPWCDLIKYHLIKPFISNKMKIN